MNYKKGRGFTRPSFFNSRPPVPPCLLRPLAAQLPQTLTPETPTPFISLDSPSLLSSVPHSKPSLVKRAVRELNPKAPENPNPSGWRARAATARWLVGGFWQHRETVSSGRRYR